MPGSDASTRDVLKIRPHSATSHASHGSKEDIPLRRTKTSLGIRPASSAASSRHGSFDSTKDGYRTKPTSKVTAWGPDVVDNALDGDDYGAKPGDLLKRLVGDGQSSGNIEGTLEGSVVGDTKPWSYTEVPDASVELDEQDTHLTGRLSSVDEDPSLSGEADTLSKRTHTWADTLQGPDYNSDEYDTDLEDDFPPEPKPETDATGRWIYEARCKHKGYIPVSFLLRKLTEDNTNLRMRHHYLGGPATKPLAEALKENTVCEEIDLSDNYIEGCGAAAMADMLKQNMFIVNLDISNNFIRSEGAEAFAEMLETNTTLKTLSLKGNQLSDVDAKLFGEALKNNMSLNCLDLSHNCFGDVGGVHLGAGLSCNIGLADLDLSWNAIRQRGAIAIAKALQKNQTLEILDLSWNGLAVVGTTALAQAIKVNKTLKVLDISNNRLNAAVAKKLGIALGKNQSLETLLMGMNPIGDEGVEAILKGIEQNQTLKLVGLEGCMDVSLSPKVKRQIHDLQETRDMMIMYTTGSTQQARINQTVLAVFDRFINDNVGRMEDLFNQMDKDNSGDITLEEFKYGLKDFGLRLTSKQLDMLLEELDSDKSGTIELSELLEGSSMVAREKQKIERQEKEALLYKEVLAQNAS